MRVLMVLCYLMSAEAFAAKINSIDFKTMDGETLVDITGSQLTGYEREEKTSPPQLVLTFENATLAEKAKRKFDTSAIGGGVLQISSYALSGGRARLVVDFAKTPDYSIDDSNSKITLHLKGNPTPVAFGDDQPQPVDVPSATTETAELPAPQKTSSSKITQEEGRDAHPELATIMKAENAQKFTGSPITLKLKDADVHEVLRLISEASGFNIIIHPTVSGKLTLSLDHVPWDQALDVVLTTLKLGAERSASVLRVMPRDLILREKQDELDQKKATAVAAPRITRVFPISYAEMGSLKTLLSDYTNAQNNAPGGSAVATTILSDTNTQSLIVRDTAENVERIRKMIQLLDVQTPQVLIEAKAVLATESFNADLNGNLGLGIKNMGFSFHNVIANTLAGSTQATSYSPTALTSGTALLSTKNAYGAITAVLNYSESVNKAKVVSSPKTVVLSGKSTSISQSQTQSVQLQNGGSAATGPTTTIYTVTATTKLDVTPRVTNDGSVFMTLSMSRDILNLQAGAPSVQPRTMNTQVIVESGGTLVIGGILDNNLATSETGIPFLRKLPLIGWLFGSETSQSDKNELMFFVTPRILNQKKTALDNTDMDEGSKL